jgi:hypothetical protein
MFNIDPTLIGRKYYTSDHHTVYTIRGIYVIPGTLTIVIAEMNSTAPIGTNPVAPISLLVTHQLKEVHMFP